MGLLGQAVGHLNPTQEERLLVVPLAVGALVAVDGSCGSFTGVACGIVAAVQEYGFDEIQMDDLAFLLGSWDYILAVYLAGLDGCQEGCCGFEDYFNALASRFTLARVTNALQKRIRRNRASRALAGQTALAG